MKTVKGQTFDRVTVVVDGTEFIDCTITNCELVYSGGKFGWMHTDISNCLITLRGPAALTVSFLDKFPLLDKKGRWDTVKLEFPEDVQ